MTKAKLVLKILSGMVLLTTVVMILILSVFIISRLVNKNNYSKVFGYSLFEVTSNSMYPYLEQGDLILVKERNKEEYLPEMVVTYQPTIGNTPITHKIIERNGDIITTKGINEETNKDNDEPFNVNQIIGEVVCVYKGYGKLEKFINNPIGIAIIFVGGLLIFEVIKFFERKLIKQENSN